MLAQGEDPPATDLKRFSIRHSFLFPASHVRSVLKVKFPPQRRL